MARTMRESNIRQLLDAEATRLLARERDLGPRVAAALANERRRSRELRLTVGSFAAAAMLLVWLGASPLVGLGLGSDLAVPTARAAETPTATAFAASVAQPPATATATTTSTPLPTG